MPRNTRESLFGGWGGLLLCLGNWCCRGAEEGWSELYMREEECWRIFLWLPGESVPLQYHKLSNLITHLSTCTVVLVFFLLFITDTTKHIVQETIVHNKRNWGLEFELEND